jgi:hypothetical protein
VPPFSAPRRDALVPPVRLPRELPPPAPIAPLRPSPRALPLRADLLRPPPFPLLFPLLEFPDCSPRGIECSLAMRFEMRGPPTTRSNKSARIAEHARGDNGDFSQVVRAGRTGLKCSERVCRPRGLLP